MIEWLLKKIVSRLESKTISTDGIPYLTRWYLWPGSPRTDDDVAGEETHDAPFGVFIHFFHRGDMDRDPHNHPWHAAIGIPLLHGYREERVTRVRSGDLRSIIAMILKWSLGMEIPPLRGEYQERGPRVIRPGSINVIHGDDFHRVELLRPDKGCWTLFIAGKNVKNWGFRLQDTGAFVPWREYLPRGPWRRQTT